MRAVAVGVTTRSSPVSPCGLELLLVIFPITVGLIEQVVDPQTSGRITEHRMIEIKAGIDDGNEHVFSGLRNQTGGAVRHVSVDQGPVQKKALRLERVHLLPPPAPWMTSAG